jgi:hypothetical protein
MTNEQPKKPCPQCGREMTYYPKSIPSPHHWCRFCRERGYADLDPSALLRKGIYPAIPDVYVKVPYRNTDKHGIASRGWTNYIIELETNATKQSIAKKNAQYDTSLTGHELIVIDLKQCENANDINALKEFLEKWIP